MMAQEKNVNPGFIVCFSLKKVNGRICWSARVDGLTNDPALN
jgi:hypothetical protein